MMTPPSWPIDVRNIDTTARLLALNNLHAAELSWLDAGAFAHLVTQSFSARGLGDADAFLLALDQDARYDSPNFRWCRARYARFVYVDRVVVTAEARGRGYARRFYEELFDRASAAGHERILCEINIEPPNPGSDGFHAALDFVEIGRAAIHGGRKSVRYMARTLTS